MRKILNCLLFYVFNLLLMGAIHVSLSVPIDEYPMVVFYYLLWMVVSCFVFGIVYLLPIRVWIGWIPLFYIAIVALLFAVLLYGTEIKGGQRWIDIGIIRFQPSEFSKLILVLCISRYFDFFIKDRKCILSDVFGKLSLCRILYFLLLYFFLFYSELYQDFQISLVLLIGILVLYEVKIVDFIVIPIYLIYLQPDFATALIVFAISVTLVLLADWSKKSLLIGLRRAMWCIIWGIILFFQDYQWFRMYDFINEPTFSYQVEQSLLAVRQGQIWGSGIGENVVICLSYLPEIFTDFTFSTVLGEFGIIGACWLLFLYSGLILTLISLAGKLEEKFCRLYVLGFASLIFWTVFLNVGSAIGIFPTVGIPLPFVSVGGSSMVMQGAGLAICYRMFKEGKSIRAFF